MTESAAIVMPKFAFKNLSFKDDAELNAYEKENSKSYGDKYFKPGSYEVVIDQVEDLGKAKKDDTWVSLCIHFKGTGEKTIKGYIQVPTDDIKYGPTKTLLPFKNLQVFCAALGYTLTVATVKEAVNAVFTHPEKLAGRPVVIQVGYQKGRVQYAGKREDGTKYFTIYDKDNNLVRDQAGLEVQFDDQAAALSYAEDNKIPVDRWVSVLSYSKSSVAATTPATASANW